MCSSRVTCVVAVSVIALAFTTPLRGDSLAADDPRVLVGDGSSSGSGGAGPVPIYNINFVVTTSTGNAPGDGTDCFVNGVDDMDSCSILNQSGQTFTSLVFDISPGENIGLICASTDFFNNCTVLQPGGGGQDTILYYDNLPGSPHIGVPYGGLFEVSFLGWPMNTTLTSGAPEPQSGNLAIIGFLIGLVLFAVRMRRRPASLNPRP